MIRHGVPFTTTIERLDAQVRRWPARWLVGYLCLVSTVALAAGIAGIARVDRTAALREALSACVSGSTALHLQGCSR
jgi:hypothetical protein